MEKQHKKTLLACYAGIFTQAVVINLSPLLYALFNTRLGVPLYLVALLSTVMFGVQIAVDSLFSKIISRIGYKKAAIAADSLCVVGLLLLSAANFAAPFFFISAGTVLMAVGSGIIEIVSSPLVEALPLGEKSASMSFLHSFYCWGHVLVVAFATAFLTIFGDKYWFLLPIIGCAVPIINGALFLSIKTVRTLEDEGRSNKFSDFGKNPVFALLFALMICAGAAEQSVAQWASYFAEIGLGIGKAAGDLAGACLFALFMALARTFYGVFGKKLKLKASLAFCSVALFCSYLLTALSPLPALSLCGIALCGVFVGIMWPGILSLSGESGLGGGTLMFALLALGGDIGCTVGPTAVGELAGLIGLNGAILCAAVFPAAMLALLLALSKKQSAVRAVSPDSAADKKQQNPAADKKQQSVEYDE